jgi:hypothetical protein
MMIVIVGLGVTPFKGQGRSKAINVDFEKIYGKSNRPAGRSLRVERAGTAVTRLDSAGGFPHAETGGGSGDGGTTM